MIWKLSKIIILSVIGLLFCSLAPSSDKQEKQDNSTKKSFFDIFSPDNLKTITPQPTKKEPDVIKDFTVYGIINSGDIKKVIIKPRRRTKQIKERMNRRGYVILNIGEKIDKYEFLKIEDDTAVFKKNEKLLRLSVFNETKNDRPSAVKVADAKIIATKPAPERPSKTSSSKTPKTSRKNKNSKVNISSKKSKTKKSSNNKNKTHKAPKNPFLELIKKSRSRKGGSTPAENPFLKLLQRHK